MPWLNDEETNAALLTDFAGIMYNVGEKLLLKIIESMEETVYGAGTPSWYPRLRMDGGLEYSFYHDKAVVSGQEINSDVLQDPMRMENDPDNYIHGSNDYKYPKGSDNLVTDVREWLTEWIIEGKSGPKFGTDGFWNKPRDFWQPIEDYINSGEADEIIEQIMNDMGIKWIKG